MQSSQKPTDDHDVDDYDDFWKALEDRKILKDEYQVIHGFDGLDNIKLIDFTWYDTGNNKSYHETKKIFGNDVVANKSDEAIFIDKGKVVKYFNDSKKAKLRVDCSAAQIPKCYV